MAITRRISMTACLLLGFAASGICAEYDGKVVGWDGTNAKQVTSFPYIMPISAEHLGTPNSIGEANKLSRCSQGAQSEFLPNAGWHGGPAYRIRPPNLNEGYGGLGSFIFGGAAAQPPNVYIRAVIKQRAGFIADTSKWIYVKSQGEGMTEETRVVPWFWAAASDGRGDYFRGDHLDWGSGGQRQAGHVNFRFGQNYRGKPNQSDQWFSLECSLELSESPRRSRCWVLTRDGTSYTTDSNQPSYWPAPGNTSPGHYGNSFEEALADSDYVTMIEGSYWWTSGLNFPLPLDADDDIYITDLKISDNYIGPPVGFIQ